MDSLLAIGIGIGLRLLVDAVSQHDFRVGGSIVGLWEGVVLYHFLQKMPRSRDPYLAYGVRLFIDFLVTESFYKMALVVLWTALGLVLADVAPFFWYDLGFGRLFRRFRRDLALLGIPVLPFFSKSSSSPSRVRFHSPPPRSLAEVPRTATPPSPRPPSAASGSSVASSGSTQTITPPRLSSRVPGSFPDDWSDVTRADSDTRRAPHDDDEETEDSTSFIMDPENDSDSTSDADPSAENPADIPEEDEYIPEDHVDQDRTPTRKDAPLPTPEDSLRDAGERDDTKRPQTPPPNSDFPVIPDGFGVEDEKAGDQDNEFLFRHDISLPHIDDPITSDAPPIQDWRFPATPPKAQDNPPNPAGHPVTFSPAKPSSLARDSSSSNRDDASSEPPAVPPKDKPPPYVKSPKVESVSPPASVRQHHSPPPPAKTDTPPPTAGETKAQATGTITEPVPTPEPTGTGSPEKPAPQIEQPVTDNQEEDKPASSPSVTDPPGENSVSGDVGSGPSQNPEPPQTQESPTEMQKEEEVVEEKGKIETQTEAEEAPKGFETQENGQEEIPEEDKVKQGLATDWQLISKEEKTTEEISPPSQEANQETSDNTADKQLSEPKEHTLNFNGVEPDVAIRQLEDALKNQSDLTNLRVQFSQSKKNRTKSQIMKLLKDRNVEYNEISKQILEIAFPSQS